MQTIIVAITVILLSLISMYTVVYVKDLASKTKFVLNLFIWSAGAMSLVLIGKMLNAENSTETMVYGLTYVFNIVLVAYISKLIVSAQRNKIAA